MQGPTTPHVAPVADPNRKIVVAIDGPAASGKSSTAQWVAQKLGFRHVDSGSLYRAVTAARLRAGGSPDEWSEPSVLAVARQVSLRPTESGFIPLIRGEPADGEIRGGEVTREVSRTARMPGVREWVNAEVRRAAAGSDVVVDGRDIGTVVFPDAQLKIFLVADPWERARRRLVQQLGRSPADEEIAEETGRLVQRDARDSTQTVQARDAILIDTTYLTQADQVERIVALAKGVGRRGPDVR
jgi:cytidylate kinase